jgi:hypothetical protein
MYSVYPDVTGSRRLPGQWWDDHEGYVSAVPANFAYGIVDHGNKPWSLIPGDGYVGSSQNVAPTSDDDEEDDDGWRDQRPDDDADRDSIDDLAPSPRNESDRVYDDADVDSEDKDMDGENADAPEESVDEEIEPPDDMDAAASNDNAADDELDNDGPSSRFMVLPIPPTPESAGFFHTLFGFAFIMLALSGHFVRKTWRQENTIPTPSL